MKKFLLAGVVGLLGAQVVVADGIDKRWALAGSGDWNVASNWSPAGIPDPGTTSNTGDNVILDNNFFGSDYVVTVSDAGRGGKTLTVSPGPGQKITLKCDSAAVPNVALTGEGTAAHDLVVNDGGRIEQTTNASSGAAIAYAAGTASFNSGSYLYYEATTDQFVSSFPVATTTFASGSTVEFGPLAYSTVPVTSRTFGNLVCTGQPFTVAGNGSFPSTIRNGIRINTGASLTFDENSGSVNLGTIGTTFTLVNNGLGGRIGNVIGPTLIVANLDISGTGTGLVMGGLLQQFGTLAIDTQVVNVLLVDYRGGYPTVINNGRFNGQMTVHPHSSTPKHFFPIGTASHARYVTLEFTTPAVTSIASLKAFFQPSPAYTQGLPLNDNGDVLVNTDIGYWTFEPLNMSGGVYNISLNIEGFHNIGDINNVRVVKRTTAALAPWTAPGTPGTNSGTTIARTGISNLSAGDFSVAAPAGQLPVSVSGFSVE